MVDMVEDSSAGMVAVVADSMVGNSIRNMRGGEEEVVLRCLVRRIASEKLRREGLEVGGRIG